MVQAADPRTGAGGQQMRPETEDRGPETTHYGPQYTLEEMDQSENRKPQSENSRVMVVGLGNPGREYREHRHNIGFMAVDRLAEKYGITPGRVQMKAIVGNGHIAGRPVILAKPQTYMNLSGDAVGSLARFYRVEPPQILVIYDELDLPLGTLRLRQKGGAGGHNGMRSIIQHLGPDFPRLRLGIGRPAGRMPPAAFVLQRFAENERPIVNELLDKAVEAIETFLSEGVDLAMTRHNGSVVDL